MQALCRYARAWSRVMMPLCSATARSRRRLEARHPALPPGQDGGDARPGVLVGTAESHSFWLRLWSLSRAGRVSVCPGKTGGMRVPPEPVHLLLRSTALLLLLTKVALGGRGHP